MPNEYFFIKKGASSPALPFSITLNGAAYSIATKTVAFTLRPANSATPIINAGSCVIDGDGTAGTGYYAWQAGDTNTAGEYLGTWVVDSGDLVLPEVGYVHVLVTER
jgi:hypothetical protein